MEEGARNTALTPVTRNRSVMDEFVRVAPGKLVQGLLLGRHKLSA